MAREETDKERRARYKALSQEEKKAEYDTYVVPRMRKKPERGMRWVTFKEYDGITVQKVLTGKAREEFWEAYNAAYKARTEEIKERAREALAKADMAEYDEEAQKLLAQGLIEWRKGPSRRIYLPGKKAGYYDIVAHEYRDHWGY
jgi:hypothetical protein